MKVVLWSAGVAAVLVVAGCILLWQHKRRVAAAIALAVGERREWHELEPRANRVLVELKKLIPQIVGPTHTALLAESAALEKTIDKARPAVAALPESVEQAPSPADIESRHRTADQLISLAQRKCNAAKQLLERTQGRIEAVTSANDELTSAVGIAISSAESQGQAGWRVDALLSDLAEIEREIQIRNVRPPIELEMSEANIIDLRQRIDGIGAEAAEYPERYRKLLDQSRDYRDRIASAESDQSWLENQLEAWALLHHWESFAVVSEHPPSIEGRLTEARELLTQTAADGGMLDKGVQDIRGATAAIQRVIALCDESDKMIDQARDLNVELARSAVDAEELVPRARQASTELAGYVAKNSHDLEKEFAGPATALRVEVDEAAGHLQLQPPNTLAAMNSANHVIAEAGHLMQSGTAEVARMTKKRSAARRSLTQASSAVNALDRYTDGIFADVFGSSRRSNVERLQASLQAAARKNSLGVNRPDSARKEANAIAQEAKRLLDKYKRADAD